MPTRLALLRALVVSSLLALVTGTGHAACPTGMTREQADATPMQLVDLPSSAGTIHIGLMPGAAPQTVAAFLDNLDNGRYDDSMFHKSWPDGTEAYNTAALDAGQYRADGEDISLIPGLATTVVDETCLENVRGAIVAVNEYTFDGRFEFYVVDPKTVWPSLPLDAWYTVFGYIVDADGDRIPNGQSLGTISQIAGFLQPDGHFALTSSFRNSLRRFPVHLPGGSPLSDQLDLSELAACYAIGAPPLFTVGALVSSVPSVPPFQLPAMSSNGFVLYDSGIDAGQLVAQTLTATTRCFNLMSIHASQNQITTPVNFTCPDQSASDEQISLILNMENRCAPDSLSRKCFVVSPGPPENFFGTTTDCQWLAVSEDMLELRREELSPQLAPLFVKLPEPDPGSLALAGLAAVLWLRRAATRRRLD